MILLINPPFSYGQLNSASPRCPPLGLAYIAAYLEKFDYKVRVLDAFALNLTEDEVKYEIKKANPDIVGITGVTSNFHQIINISSMVKDIDNEIKVVIGGPHATIEPESCFINNSVDYAVIGEGEVTFKELVDSIIIKKRNIKTIKGIAFKLEKKIIKTPYRPFIKNLDSLPLPAYHLLPMKSYRPYATFDIGKRFSSMITSRGCPFSCAFCSSSAMFGHTYRANSPERVLTEIELLHEKYKIDHIYFQDDEFTILHSRTENICDMMMERKLNIIWECLSRTDHISKELLMKMKKAGCVSIVYGIESGCPKILGKINKNIPQKQIINACKWAKEAEIMCKISFIIGFPWESEKEIINTINFAKSLKADYANFSVLTPFSNTEIYKTIKKMKLLISNDWNRFSPYQKVPVIKTKYLNNNEITKWAGKAHLNFYLRPSFLLKKLFFFNRLYFNKTYAKRNIKAGFDLIKMNINRFIE